MYRRVNGLANLGRLMQGKEIDEPVSEVARWAMYWVKIGLAQTEAAAEVRELERLYQSRESRTDDI